MVDAAQVAPARREEAEAWVQQKEKTRLAGAQDTRGSEDTEN